MDNQETMIALGTYTDRRRTNKNRTQRTNKKMTDPTRQSG